MNYEGGNVMANVKLTVEFYPEGFGIRKKHSWQTKTFADELSAIEWCRKNYLKIGVINNYRTLGLPISHFDIIDAIRGVSY